MNEPLQAFDRVELISSNDPDPVPVGTKGIVQKDGEEFQGQKIYSVRWDNGRTLNLLEGEDDWKKL